MTRLIAPLLLFVCATVGMAAQQAIDQQVALRRIELQIDEARVAREAGQEAKAKELSTKVREAVVSRLDGSATPDIAVWRLLAMVAILDQNRWDAQAASLGLRRSLQSGEVTDQDITLLAILEELGVDDLLSADDGHPDRPARLIRLATAMHVLDEALVLARTHNNAAQIGRIALVQMQAGEANLAAETFAESLAAASRIPGSYTRDGALSAIAAAQADAGLFTEAMATAMTIEPDYWRAMALQSIASAQIQDEKLIDARATLEEAVTVAQVIKREVNRPWLLSGIAETMAQAGSFERARDIARQIQQASAKSSALVAIAKAQAQAGLYSDALATAESIEEVFSRELALYLMAHAQAQAGDFTEAAITAMNIEHAGQRFNACYEVSMAQIKAGQLDQAQVLIAQLKEHAQAEQLDQTLMQAAIFLMSAEAQLQAGDRQKASSTMTQAAANVKNMQVEDNQAAYFRTISLLQIAAAQARAGWHDEAAITFDVALDLISDMESTQKAIALRDIAVVQAQAGYFADALATARMSPVHTKAQALCDVAALMVQQLDEDLAPEES